MKYYNEFLDLLEKENKDQAVMFVVNLLENNQLSLEDLYQYLIEPSLKELPCSHEDIKVWKEHARTSIVRTIIECTFPYVVKRKALVNSNQLKVLVVTPSEEYHELGAMIVTNMFNLNGFDAQFIGANTPKKDILSALNMYQPDYLALSVTNYYHITTTKKIIDDIKKSYPEIKVILGGQAFRHEGALSQVDYDYYLETYEAIYHFAKEVMT